MTPINNHLVELKDIIQTIGPESCPNKINLHCHTTLSDGSLTPEKLITQAIQMDLDHIAITDHHSIQSYQYVISFLAETTSKVRTKFWSGIEISCILCNTLVHIIGLDFNITSSYMKPYITAEAATGNHLQASSVIKAIKLSGGLAILAHPARYRISYKQLILEAEKHGIDGAEAWYDYNRSLIWKPTYFVCDKIDKLLAELGLLATCGTDTHGLSLKHR